MSNSSYIAFGKFKDSIRNYEESSNGNRTFQALINYAYQDKIIEENLAVKLHLTTEEGGMIELAEGKKLLSNKVHLDFNPKWRDYRCAADGILTITGSGKIGSYTVKIREAF
jgi:hypothetical protein